MFSLHNGSSGGIVIVILTPGQYKTYNSFLQIAPVFMKTVIDNAKNDYH